LRKGKLFKILDAVFGVFLCINQSIVGLHFNFSDLLFLLFKKYLQIMVTLLQLFVFRPQSFEMTPLLESFAVPLVLTHFVLLA
jgi:hypothetical protein